MTSYRVRVVWLVWVLLLLSGCGNSVSTVEARPSLNEEDLIASTEASISLDEVYVDGVINQDLIIPIVSEEEDQEVAVITIPQETKFQDTNGTALYDVPILKVLVEESSSADLDNIVKGKISFIYNDNFIAIPTEAIKITMAAPRNAHPGDTVRVEFPDNAILVKLFVRNEKVSFYTVDLNGNVSFWLFPEAFRNSYIVEIIIEYVIGTETNIVGNETTTDEVTEDETTVTDEVTEDETIIDTEDETTADDVGTIVPYVPTYVEPITGAEGGS